MSEERRIVISSASHSTIIRDIEKVKDMLPEDQFDRLLNILSDLDIWAMKNDVNIEFESNK
jgi:hypothetical protein